jgi:hypothetical protein
MKLSVSDNSLLIFVDDTGHEALVPGHPVYGLGGCAIMAGDLERVIRHPWQEVRRQMRGLADMPLHAAALGHPPRREDFEMVAGFFRSQPFARIGATVTVNTTLAGELAPIDAIAGVLKNRIVDIAKWTPFTEVHVIFESSDRADRRIEAAFGDFRLEEDGRATAVECYFMPKAVHDPALEVADFVMHAVGRQARRRIGGKAGFARDFEAVFHHQDPRRVSYIEISEARREPIE